MNLNVVENILGVIKTSTDKSVIVKGLVKLRTDLIKDREGIVLFRQANGIPPMVRFLSKPHEQILEIVLSILGNCCVDEICCREALENKVSIHLATILKSIPNALIQCRACRLLGNIAKVDSELLLATHCVAIAQSVCKIVEDTSDVQTRIMAFRANRFLLANPQYFRNFIHSSGFVGLLRILAAVMKNDAASLEQLTVTEQKPLKIGLKKNQHREKYFEEVARNLEGVRSDIFDHEVLKTEPRYLNLYIMPKERMALDLAIEILRCLLVISEVQMSLHVWKALTHNNCTFTPIVYFASKDNSYRSIALKILSNFSKNPGAFGLLSASDAVVGACDLLVTTDLTKPLSESERRHCVNIVCILSTDACHRAKVRRSGALRTLIALIRSSKSESEKTLILYILNNFQYDNMSMDLMLWDGLITILITELNSYLTLDDDYHKRKREEKQQTAKKRKIPNPCSDSFNKVIIRETIIDSDSPSSSPRSYASPSSPCSSRSISPVGIAGGFKTDADGSDEESYSPVCSDDEDDDDDDKDNEDKSMTCDTTSEALSLPNSTACSEIMKLLEACQPSTVDDTLLDKDEDDEISQDATTTKVSQFGHMTRSALDIIENLLFRVTLLVHKRDSLGKPDTMQTLIKAINVFGANNNFAGSLTNILLESKFFVQVIKCGVVHELALLAKNEEMRKETFGIIDTLTCVGESNYGKSELVRLLRSEVDFIQKRAAIAVAYIIKNPRLLYNLINENNALSILLGTILTNKNDEYAVEAVEALTTMCRYPLGISVPKLDAKKRSVDYEEYIEDLSAPLHEDCDMSFIVHVTKDDVTSTTTLGFNKKLLCDTSEVFHTMLTSDFREGKEGVIHLHTCTPSGLRYFLNLIKCQAQNKKFNIPQPSIYHILLEAFEMSRIYIIPTMEQRVLDLLIWLLDETNCLSVLEWSMKNYHAELTEMAINYYLCSPLEPDVKVKLFRSADYSTYSAEWFQLIFEGVMARCPNIF